VQTRDDGSSGDWAIMSAFATPGTSSGILGSGAVQDAGHDASLAVIWRKTRPGRATDPPQLAPPGSWDCLARAGPRIGPANHPGKTGAP